MCHYGRGHLFILGFKCNNITSSNDLYWKHNKSQYTVIGGNIPFFFLKKNNNSEETTNSEVCLPSAGGELSTEKLSYWNSERGM